jgi:GTP cyclohydrolase I
MYPHPLHEINLILRVDHLFGLSGREHVFDAVLRFFYFYDNKDRNSIVDREKIISAVKLLLEGIGEDPDREGLVETPERVARMCEDIFGGLNEDPDEHLAKQFQVSDSEIVIEKDIVFYSTCEHHLLPFFGKVHIAYIPNGYVQD